MRFRFSFSASDMHMYFGLPGSGKSTVCADIVRQILKKKQFKKTKVFCNFPVVGAYNIDRADIGLFDLRDQDHDQAVLLLDEASTVYFKRNAVSKDPKKQLRDDENKFHSMHRHYKTMEVFFAQSWDGVDLRLRELSTDLFYVQRSRIRGFIKIRRIAKIFAISEDHQPIDGYDFVKFSARYVYAPLAWKLFDTYHCPPLPEKTFEKWQDPSLIE